MENNTKGIEVKEQIRLGIFCAGGIIAYLTVGNILENKISAYAMITNKYYLVFVLSIIYKAVISFMIRILIMHIRDEKNNKHWKINIVAASTFIMLFFCGGILLMNHIGQQIITAQVYIVSIWTSLFLSFERV